MRFLATILAFFIFSFNLSAVAVNADNTVYEPRVYITETGSYYHSADCHYLRRSKIAIGLYQAKENGYSACSYCGGKSDGWDYFADSDYTAPDDAPSIGYPKTDNQQSETQSNKKDSTNNNEWLGIIVFIGLIVFVIVKIKNEKNNK